MELDASEQLCVAMLKETPKVRSRHHMRSAMNHLRAAELLLEIDRPMAVFRSLTAVEEAAAALIQCFKEQGYESASILKWTNHLHKNAFIPFLKVLGDAVEKLLLQQGVAIDLTVREVDGKKRQLLELEFNTVGGPLKVIPFPPLSGQIQVNGVAVSLDEQMKGYAQLVGTDTVRDHVVRLKNWRNQVLYASDKGYVADVDPEQASSLFHDAKRWVFVQMRAYLLIQPYPPQSFVEHVLVEFLQMLATPKLVADYTALAP